MEQLKKLARNVVDGRPIVELFDDAREQGFALSSSSTAGEQRKPRAKRLNPHFEDWRGDAEIHAKWIFHYPRCVQATNGSGTQALDLYSMLRDVYGRQRLDQAGDDVKTTLESLSLTMSGLKRRINTRDAEEHDYLFYLHLLATLGQSLDNGPLVYRYHAPDDDDGVNRGEKEKHAAIEFSDQFLFERLHVLLSLLAYHHHSLERKTNTRERTETMQKCIDVLLELDRLSLDSQATGTTTTTKLSYRKQPSSLSSEHSRASSLEATERRRSITAPGFIEQCLGGRSSLMARLALCRAARYELICEDQLQQKKPDETRMVMGSIVAAYAQAYEAAALYDRASKLTHSMRLMHLYWLCRANLYCARELAASPQQCERMEALQRVSFVVGRHKEYLAEKSGFVPDNQLRDAYNETILQADQLLRRLDQDFYQIGVKVSERDFSTLETYQFNERVVFLPTAMRTSVPPALLHAVVLLEKTLTCAPDETLVASSASLSSTLRPRETRTSQREEDDLSALLRTSTNETRLAVQLERRNWLLYCLAMFGEGVFIESEMHPDAARFTKELQLCQEAIQRF